MMCDKVEISVCEIHKMNCDTGFTRVEDATGGERPVVEVFKTHNHSSSSVMQC